MADAPETARPPSRSARLRAALRPWAGRRAVRADGLPASPKPTARRMLRFAGGGVLAIAAVLGALWLAILYLPLPASQVVPRVEAALQERLGPDYAVSIADAELRRGGGGVELNLVDLSIAKSRGGPVVASVPRVELRLDGMSLLTGEVKIRSVHVTSPKLDMRFDTTLDAASKNSDLPGRVLAAIGDLDRLLGANGAAGALEEVDVADATVLVAPRARAPVSLGGVDLRLSRGAGGAIALAASSSRPNDRWTSAVTVSVPAAGDQARSIDLGLENVDLAPYSAPLAEKAGAPPVKGRLSGHLSMRIGAEASLLSGEGRIEARGLELTMPGPAASADEPAPEPRSVGAERVQLALRWDAAARALQIEPSQVRGKGGQMSFTGVLGAPAEAGQPWTATLDGRDILLSGDSAADPPLRLDRIDLAATFDPTSGLLDVSRAQFLGPTARAAATAAIRFEGASPAVRVGLVSEPMPASAIKRLWPFFLATSVRSWVVENVGAGTVDRLSLTIDVPSGALATIGPHDPLPPGSMALDIGFSDGVMRGAPGMPWIEGAKGYVRSTARETEVGVERAQLASADADGPLTVSDIVFKVADLAPRYPKARVTVKADGSLRRALTLVSSGAFGANPLPQQLDVSKVSGRIVADVAAEMELAHTGKGPPPAVQISADMRDVKIAGVFAGRNFEKGALQLKAGAGPVSVSGKGQVGGAQASVAMTETPATDTAPVRRKLAVTLTADAADLQRFGLEVPGSLRGEVPLVAELSLDDPKSPMGVSADLVNVGIDGLVPGFKKPAGRAGRLAFQVERGADKTTIKDFVLESGDRSVRGTVEFNAKGELLSATLPIYRPAPGDDARVEIDKAKGGVTKIMVQGAALDLKPLLDQVRGKPSSASVAAQEAAKDSSAVPKNLDVAAKLGTGLGYGGEAIAGLDIKLEVRDGKVRDADGTGRVGRGPISLATGDDGRLAVAGGDAGAFFRFADFYGRIDGGAFDLTASLSGGPGVLRIRQFAVRDETALERARQTTGADQNAPTPPSRGATRFDRLQVSFVQAGGQLKISEAVVYGPQIGATLAGTVNYSADKVDLVGTFVPIYALNNLFSRVPIIGTLLGGGKNGGLVGVTFSVRGPTTSPTILINPISAVAPGFFRKLFEFRERTPPSAEAPTGSAPAAPSGGGTASGATQQ